MLETLAGTRAPVKDVADSIFCAEPPEEERDGVLTTIPEAVIEVVSKGYEAKDLQIGPPFYLSQGGKHVVVFDPATPGSRAASPMRRDRCCSRCTARRRRRPRSSGHCCTHPGSCWRMSAASWPRTRCCNSRPTAGSAPPARRWRRTTIGSGSASWPPPRPASRNWTSRPRSRRSSTPSAPPRLTWWSRRAASRSRSVAPCTRPVGCHCCTCHGHSAWRAAPDRPASPVLLLEGGAFDACPTDAVIAAVAAQLGGDPGALGALDLLEPGQAPVAPARTAQRVSPLAAGRLPPLTAPERQAIAALALAALFTARTATGRWPYEDGAEQAFREAVCYAEAAGGEISVAVATGRIADILEARGQRRSGRAVIDKFDWLRGGPGFCGAPSGQLVAMGEVGTQENSS